MTDETIIAAAIRFNDITGPNGDPMPPVIVLCERPGRHWHAMHGILGCGVQSTVGVDQGFLTSTGRFVEREEGGRIASAAGQLLAGEGEFNNHLFSEDVW